MRRARARPFWAATAVVGLQTAAAIYFLIDAANEIAPAAPGHDGSLGFVDLLVGLALLAGIGLSAGVARRMADEARRRDEALAVARGALTLIVRDRFGSWGLTGAEADVALLALKGCSPGEIAQMRRAAPGTVRSQLSQVYAKAGVSGQPMLMSLFLDDLLDADGVSGG